MNGSLAAERSPFWLSCQQENCTLCWEEGQDDFLNWKDHSGIGIREIIGIRFAFGRTE